MSDARLAIVTGTSSGIGTAVARALLADAWRVVGVARRVAPLEHQSYQHLRADLRDIGSLSRSTEPSLTALLRDPRWRRIGLVNNAADPGLLGQIPHLDVRRLAEVFAVNVAAPIWFMGLVLRLAPPDASIRIVNISSGAAGRAIPGLGAYGSSKAALRMTGMVLAAELEAAADPSLRGRDVTILSYEPGTVDTPMQASARTQPVDVLPSVGMFVDFKNASRLVPPEAPAREITAFLENGAGPRFQERRIGA